MLGNRNRPLTISSAVDYTPQYELRTATPRAPLIAVLAIELFIFLSKLLNPLEANRPGSSLQKSRGQFDSDRVVHGPLA